MLDSVEARVEAGVVLIHQTLLRSCWLVCLALAWISSSARAQDDRVSGFKTSYAGALTGTVLDSDGHPIGGIEVHVTWPGGETTVVADQAGRYKVDLPPGDKFVFVRRAARINGQTLAAETLESGEEVVAIQEADQPKVMPKVLSQTTNLAYSDKARDADAWAKAWLMLEIDVQGRVHRVKLLHDPGYDLDSIAIREAFKMRFTPARNAGGKPVAALILWSYEWPSYWWMYEHKYTPGQVPEAASTVPCKGEARDVARFRDCTTADVARALEAPWIELDSPLAEPARRLEAQRSSGGARWYHDWPGWVIAGTGVVAIATSVYLVTSAETLDERATNEEEPYRTRLELRADNRRLSGYVFAAAGLISLGTGIAKLAIHTDGKSAVEVTLAGRF
jgi:hypothetical protein